MDLLEVAVGIEITNLMQQGGVTSWHVSEAQSRLRSIRENNVSESMLYRSKDTPHSFQIWSECLAVLAFVPGGVTFAGNHYEVPREYWYCWEN